MSYTLAQLGSAFARIVAVDPDAELTPIGLRFRIDTAHGAWTAADLATLAADVAAELENL